MQKITFHNNVNDLEVSFATDTPGAFLSAFDGNSLGAEFVQFKPLSHDGSRTLSHTLDARTVTFTAVWYAVEGGRRSRPKALEMWQKLQYAFAIGDKGTLTWTNGTDVRTIECYAAETPALHESVGSLFSAEFTLTADYPLWRGNTAHSKSFSGRFTSDGLTIENICPIAVPFVAVLDGSIASIYCPKQAKRLDIDITRRGGYGYPVYIDTAKQRVYGFSPNADGEITEDDLTACLSPRSAFFDLMPGSNLIVLTMNAGAAETDATVKFEWYDYYLGVSK